MLASLWLFNKQLELLLKQWQPTVLIVMFCPPFPHEALRIFLWKIPIELQGGQTNFLNENYGI